MLHDKETSKDRLEAWITDTQENIDISDWEKVCLKAQKQTVNTRLRLLQYKWLMRTYITPVKLHQWAPDTPDLCNKCTNDKGTLFHCLWDCWKIENFWKSVTQTLSSIVGVRVPLRATLCILGLYPKDFVINKKQATLVDFGLLQARRTIALFWKSVDAPPLKVWITEMASCFALERLTYILRGKAEDFEIIWKPLTEFLKNK